MAKTFPTNCAGHEFPLTGIDCDEKRKNPPTDPAWSPCMCKEFCAKMKGFNKRKKRKRVASPGHGGGTKKQRTAYKAGKERFVEIFDEKVEKYGENSRRVQKMFAHKCRYDEWMEGGAKRPIDRTRETGMNPDHIQDAAIGGSLGVRNLKWMNARVNQSLPGAMKNFDPNIHTKIRTNPNCRCGR